MSAGAARTSRGERVGLRLMLLPALIVFGAFFLLPLARLVSAGKGGALGWANYALIVTNARYFASLVSTVLLSGAVTTATLILSGTVGLFLQRSRFPGRSLLTALLTLPLAFPGVVVGFMVIMLAGRQGLIGGVGEAIFGYRPVFAYSMSGLFAGYVYFSIPRVVLTVMAAAESLDSDLEAAARSLGATPWRILLDILLPALRPALIAAGAICFAT